MNTITLMVLPSPKDVSGLQFFIECNGVWYELQSGVSSGEPLTSGKVDEWLRRHMQALDNNPDADLSFSLRTIGGTRLYKKLLPEQLQQCLKEMADENAGGPAVVLRIHTMIEWIPWELMHDGTDFLGIRFQIARLPITKAPIALDKHVAQVRQVGHICNLLGNHVLDDEQLQHWARTFTDLQIEPECEFRRPSLNGAIQDFPNLRSLEELEENRRQPDILHITCHGDIETAEGEIYWTLDHQSEMEIEYKIDQHVINEMSNMLKFTAKAPLIFGNACASASIQANGNGHGELLSGFGSNFFELGASAFVGTFAPVSKRLAVEFARQFYRRLLADGLPIGEALRATKQHFRDHGETDPSWLFYCLYGVPENKYQMEQ